MGRDHPARLTARDLLDDCQTTLLVVFQSPVLDTHSNLGETGTFSRARTSWESTRCLARLPRPSNSQSYPRKSSSLTVNRRGICLWVTEQAGSSPRREEPTPLCVGIVVHWMKVPTMIRWAVACRYTQKGSITSKGILTQSSTIDNQELLDPWDREIRISKLDTWP